MLIVEPSAARREVLGNFFRGHGFEVITLDDPKLVLTALASALPDVVLLDVESDGIQTCRQLRVTPITRLTPVILMAGDQPDESTIVRALTCGADDYVGCGVSIGELNARVRLQLRNRRDRELLTEALNRGNQYKDEAYTDALTRLPNRRAAERELPLLLASSPGIALLMMDIDHFKSINDRFGHPVGDQVLQALAATLERTARDQDFYARMGGEEFLVAVPVSSETEARDCGERYRFAVEEMALSRDIPIHGVTVSVGVSFWQGGEDGVIAHEQLLSAADQALYRAKGSGRNRVEIAWH